MTPPTTLHDPPTAAGPEPGTDAPTPTPADRWILPVWFEALLVVVTAVVVGTGLIGLVLAVAGHYSLAAALGGGLVLAAVVAVPVLARLTRGREGRSAHLPAGAMTLVAVVSAAANARFSSASVLVDRDAGVYAVAGRWLAAHGTLRVPAGAAWTAVAGSTDPSSTGVYTESGGVVEFPSDHLLPTLLAVLHGLGGDRAMAVLTPLLGALALLAVFAVGVRLCRRPWVVVAVVTALGIGLPQLEVSRDTLSEPLTQLLLWSGLWLLLTALDRRRLGPAVLGGLTLGATLTSRVDALLYLAALPAVAGVIWAVAPDRRRFVARWAGTALLAAVPPAVLAAVDLRLRGTPDTAAFRAQVDHPALLVAVAVVVGVVAAVVLARLAGRDRFVSGASAVGAGLGALVSVGLLAAWALRPAVQQLKGTPDPVVAALQAHEFVPAAPELTYSEYTLTWFSWYLGPVLLVLAVAGAGLLVRSAFRGAAAPLLVVAATTPVAVRYLWAVSATPDQVDVMQRYVPVVLPAFALAGGVALAALVDVTHRVARPTWGRSVLALGAVAVLAFPLARLEPVFRFEDQTGFVAAVDRVCGALGPRAAVALTPDDTTSDGLAQTLRSYCDVPVTRLTSAAPTTVDTVADAATAQGRTLWVLGGSEAGVAALAPGGPAPRQLAAVANARELESTLTRPPAVYVSGSLTVWGVRVG